MIPHCAAGQSPLRRTRMQDFVAASFVQSKQDVMHVRQVLDAAGGHAVKIISKIENESSLRNFQGASRKKR
jgi:pyruvate kinase